MSAANPERSRDEVDREDRARSSVGRGAWIAVVAAGLPLVAVAVVGCGGALSPPEPAERIRMGWHPVELSDRELPAGIRLYEGRDPEIPLRAWFARVAAEAPGIDVRVVMSTGGDGLETVTSMAGRLGARVAVNAGYFREDLRPAEHVGLVMVDRRLLWPATPSVIRDGVRYHVARAAIGFAERGVVEVAWARSRRESALRFEEPLDNRPGRPAPAPEPAADRVWDVRHAVQGGPMLVRDGRVRVSVDEEAFFDTPILDVHPRTGACATADGELILMVVDGRQGGSRGAYLGELARMLLEVGCVDALNLDGGGSSTLVVDGELVNRPEGSTAERPVMSALAVLDR